MEAAGSTMHPLMALMRQAMAEKEKRVISMGAEQARKSGMDPLKAMTESLKRNEAREKEKEKEKQRVIAADIRENYVIKVEEARKLKEMQRKMKDAKKKKAARRREKKNSPAKVKAAATNAQEAAAKAKEGSSAAEPAKPDETATGDAQEAAEAVEEPAKPEEAATGDAQEAVEEPAKSEETATGDAQEALEEPVKPEVAAARARYMARLAERAREELTNCTAPKFGTEGREARKAIWSKEKAAWEWAKSPEEVAAVTFRDSWNIFLLPWGSYEETTTIPSMLYAHSASRYQGVFGHVLIRDQLDYKRNMIFDRQREDCETVNREDPYLALTGPTRAVVASVVDPFFIEVDLKVKGSTESEDYDLTSLLVHYRANTISEISCYTSRRSTLQFTFCYIPSSVETTVMVKVTRGSWPDGLRGVFTAASKDDWTVKLLDFGDGKLPICADGLVNLSRRVVSVGLKKGELKVRVVACPFNTEQVVLSDEATFAPEKDGISSGVELKVGSCRLEVSVGWSLFDL